MARALRTMTFTEPKNLSDVLKFEFGTISRELVTIPDGQGDLEIGTPLARLISGGDVDKYVPAVDDDEATDGSNKAVAVLAQRVPDSDTDVTNVIVIHRLAEVSALGLEWDASVDNAAKKAAKIADLAANMIIVRATQ